MAVHALLNAAMYVYEELRYGYSAVEWICIAFVVMTLTHGETEEPFRLFLCHLD